MKKSRVLAMMLVVVMVVATMSTAVFAVEPPANAKVRVTEKTVTATFSEDQPKVWDIWDTEGNFGTYSTTGDALNITGGAVPFVTLSGFGSNLENVTLPDTLEDMGAYAFTGCTKLTEVDLSNTKIKKVGAKAFAGCGKLTTLTIPETVMGTSGIASNVFCEYGGVDTDRLTRLNFGGTLATWNNFTYRAATNNPNLADGTCTVYCSDGTTRKE